MKKLYFLLLLVFIFFNANAQSISNQEKFYLNDPSYNRGGLYYNGFRLKNNETTYTNTFLLLNSFGVGLANVLELNASVAVLPLSGNSGVGIIPLILLIPRAGYDFGSFQHISGSFIFSPFIIPSSKPMLANKQLAYTFGTPKNNIGIVYSVDEMINQNANFIYLQSSFKILRWLKIGMEHVLFTNYFEINSNNLYSTFKKPISEYLVPWNLMFRINPTNKTTFCIGYFTECQYKEKQILYLSMNVRLNNMNN